jgi:hypothetical protein
MRYKYLSLFLTGFVAILMLSFVLPLQAVFVMMHIFKVGLEVVLTPVTYLVVGALKKAEGVDVVGTDTYSPFRLREAP